VIQEAVSVWGTGGVGWVGKEKKEEISEKLKKLEKWCTSYCRKLYQRGVGGLVNEWNGRSGWFDLVGREIEVLTGAGKRRHNVNETPYASEWRNGDCFAGQ